MCHDHRWDGVLIGGREEGTITIADYDPAWPDRFEQHARLIRAALGAAALCVEHIGSTSVPGLAAKPIVDVLLVVSDSGDEVAYLPALEEAGYQLRVRESNAHEHRIVRTPERDVHVHIYSVGCPEIDRYFAFRERLRQNEADRVRYEHTKRTLAAQSWPDMNAYADAKSDVIESIIAAGMRHHPRPS